MGHKGLFLSPLVSIIIPSYNTASYIKYTLDSVSNQSFKNFECLIIDDFSSDNSTEIISEYSKKDSRFKHIILEKNIGVSEVRNLALDLAKGRFIAFLDSDDTWEEKKLEIQIDFMIKNNVLFSYTPYFVIDEKGKKIGSFMPKETLNYSALLKTCDIGNSTVIYDSSVLGKIQSGKIRHDYEIWLKILKVTPAYRTTDCSLLSSIRIRKGSDTYNKFKSAQKQWRIYREVEKINLIKSIYYFIHYVYYGFKKRLSYFNGDKT